MVGAVVTSLTACNQIEPLLVRPRIAWRMLGCGNTYGYALLARGELQSFRDGRSRKITIESIHRYIARQLGNSAATQLEPKRRRGRPRKTPSITRFQAVS